MSDFKVGDKVRYTYLGEEKQGEVFAIFSEDNTIMAGERLPDDHEYSGFRGSMWLNNGAEPQAAFGPLRKVEEKR